MTTEGILLTDLPIELLEHILSMLPLLDRKSASLVCHLWNELTFHRRSSMRNVALMVQFHSAQSQRSYLRNSSRQYRNVAVNYASVPFDFGLIVEILDLFGANLECFRCLTKLTEEQLWNVVTRAPYLQQFIVKMDSTPSNLEKFTFPEMKHLRLLETWGNVLRIRSLSVPNLTQLAVVFGSLSDTTESVAALRRLAPQLKGLSLTSASFIPFVDLQFPRVEVLELVLIWLGNNNAFSKFMAGLKALKEVKLSFIIKEVVLDAITIACPGIERLQIQHEVLEPNHFCFLWRLEHLQKLHLTGSIDFPASFNFKPLVSVKRLALQLCDRDSGEVNVFEGFRQLLPNVIDMTVNLVTNFPEEDLENIFAIFPQLKRLCMHRPTNCMVSKALQHLVHLEELTLKHADEALKLKQPSKCLKRLHFFYDKFSTVDDLTTLPEAYPNLKRLDLKLCRQVTASDINELRTRLNDCAVHCIEPNPLDYDTKPRFRVRY